MFPNLDKVYVVGDEIMLFLKTILDKLKNLRVRLSIFEIGGAIENRLFDSATLSLLKQLKRIR